MKSFVHILTASAVFYTHVLAHGDEDHGDGDHTKTKTITTDTMDDAVTHTAPTTSVPPPTQEGCPTVTVTGELCTTCPIPECLVMSTATQSCGCPDAIPTVTLDFPCEDNCSGVFCTTTWSYETETCEPTDSSTSEEPEPTADGSTTIPGDTAEPSGTPDQTGTSSTDSTAPPVTVEPNAGVKHGASAFALVAACVLALM